jgi:hypothetical protein
MYAAVGNYRGRVRQVCILKGQPYRPTYAGNNLPYICIERISFGITLDHLLRRRMSRKIAAHH